jgi:hypothetical protein
MTEYNLSPTHPMALNCSGIGPPVHIVRLFPEGLRFFEADPSLRIPPKPRALFGVELES